MLRGCLALTVALLVVPPNIASSADDQAVLYARFEVDGRTAFGTVEGDKIHEIKGRLFGKRKPSGTVHNLKDVRLLVPTNPRQILALAGNYRSHLNGPVPERLKIPQPFVKTWSSLAAHGDEIVIPKDSSGDIHYEAELVIVIGKKAKDVPKEQALDYVFGVTAGNDVSERFWQNDEQHKDVQWWRAKGSDTFSPCGPYIVTGVNYDDLLMELRVNGEVKQSERTSHMIHDVAGIVSFISQYVTLYPGDLIFTGTSGKTSAIKAGDVVEIELEGMGVLRNEVVAEE